VSSTSFTEIEHKFIVDKNFDKEDFFNKIRALSPTKIAKIAVRDTYFVLQNDKKHVYRHRFDNEIQQLTVKSVESDSAVRTEINLPIDQSKGDQKAAVAAFMKALGCSWSGEIRKNIDVAYFADCEIVFYQAVGPSRVVHCVEFEAVSPASIDAGLAILKKYETTLGFAGRQRESKSLFELALLDGAPEGVRKLFL
jgi:adenylate cyclase class IV